MRKVAVFFMVTCCVFLLGASYAAGATVQVNVDGQAMPWLSLLNSAFPYGDQDGLGPTVVDAGSGISFAAGGTFTITYVSGFTNAFGSDPLLDVDGDGYPGVPNKYYDPYPIPVNAPGSTGNGFPTQYIDLPVTPTDAAYFLNALVGTFADASGTIVGSPFHVGNGPFSVIAPSGATRLQLGLDDDLFVDNTGSLLVSVSGPSAVPVPATVLLFGSGLVGLAGFRWRFKRS